MTSSTKPDIVEHVAKAIDETQLFLRYNDWTGDRVPGMPIEICRHGKEGEPEIVVVKRFPQDRDESDCLYEVVSDCRARAAIIATLQYARYNVSASMVRAGQDGAESVLRAMLDTLLQEIGDGE